MIFYVSHIISMPEKLESFSGPCFAHGRLCICGGDFHAFRIFDRFSVFIFDEQIVVLAYGQRNSACRIHKVDGAFDLASFKAASALGLRIIGAMDLFDGAVRVFDDICACYIICAF